MGKVLSVLFLVAVWSAVTVFAVLWGSQYNWPDYVHTDYGLPLTWATHTTSTFVGPVNLWSVDLAALAVDLTVWLGGLTVAVAVLLGRLEKPQEQPPLDSRASLLLNRNNCDADCQRNDNHGEHSD
jgi:hypothetical protein